MQVVDEETSVENVVRSGEPIELQGPNRDRGKLLSFALKGDLSFRVLTNTDTDEQALVVSAPEGVIRKMAYDIVKHVEAQDTARASTRPKED